MQASISSAYVRIDPFNVEGDGNSYDYPKWMGSAA